MRLLVVEDESLLAQQIKDQLQQQQLQAHIAHAFSPLPTQRLSHVPWTSRPNRTARSPE